MEDNRHIKEFLLKMADDQLILGHRNSEWTGLGPLLEEDIAFSSMAQDKIGHSFAMFQLLHQLGCPEPDQYAFHRPVNEFRNCQLVELPIGEYDFSLARHFFFDYAEGVRFEALSESSYEPLRHLAKKIRGELNYHMLHAKSWMKKLGNGTDEGLERMQATIHELYPYALGIWEPSPYEIELIDGGVFAGENTCEARWKEKIGAVLEQTPLTLPSEDEVMPNYGGRQGKHTEYLAPLVSEMTEVLNLDRDAAW